MMKTQLRLALTTGIGILSTSLFAQTYLAVELPGSGAVANASFGGFAGGLANASAANFSLGHATIWDTNGSYSGSSINGGAGSFMVGFGRGDITNQRLAAMIWNNGVPSLMSMPNGGVNYSSQAFATDGTQIVGQYIPWASKQDTINPGDSHAWVYNPSTGQFTDLYNGNPTIAYGVGGGQQVGYEMKGQAEARLWTGNPKSFVNLHPAGFVASIAAATDGTNQVGFIGQLVQKAGEANKKGIKIRYDWAVQWSGSAASMRYLPSAYPNSRATGISGSFISGIGTVTNQFGTRGAQHAIVWIDSLSSAIELHDLLPSNYVQSFAYGVDASGNVSGMAIDSLGQRHAIFWVKIG
jgi:hypothetical protein